MTIKGIVAIAYADEIAAENKRKVKMQEIGLGFDCSLFY